MQECQHESPKYSFASRVGQPRSKFGAGYARINANRENISGVGQHAGMVGQHVQERWVNMVRNIHCLPIDYKVTNENDSKAMGTMLRRAKTILQTNQFTALYDKGFHTGSEIKKGIEMGVNIMVAVPGVASFAPDENSNSRNCID